MSNSAKSGHVVMMSCGDVGPVHGPVETYAENVRSALGAVDLRLAQCERVYSERGELQVHSGGEHSRVTPSMAQVFSDCGFDVVSVASNHSMDWGPTAMLDSVEVLRARGIQTVGAGRDIEEARAPAIVEINGTRIAILAYCSVLREGYAAGPHRPGVAPLRAHSYFEPIEYQAGVPPRVVTIPFEDDLAGLMESVTAAKESADVIVLSIHWGVHFIPRLIADYQITVASQAFAAGVDLLVGHHAHVPKAIGVYEGKACFFSLSNFIMSCPERSPADAAHFTQRYGVLLDPDYPRLPYGTDGKRSLIARAELAKDGVDRVSFLPVLIDTHLKPVILKNGDPRFGEMIEYMEWVSEGFPHQFTVEGDEVVVETG